MMQIAFLGDIMPGGVIHYKNEYIDSDVLNYLGNFDLRVACLESAIGDEETFDEDKLKGRINIIYAKNQDLQRVHQMGIDVVTIANNHVYDLGEKGLLNTIYMLDELGIKHCGAGKNLKEARMPAVVSIKDKTIAFLAACQYGNQYLGHVKLATQNSAGINPLNIEDFCEDIRLAKNKYDYVIALPHWGIEHIYLPTSEIKRWSYKMITAGADAVIGGHPHNIQPVIKYNNKPIAYSLGNFLFPDFYMRPPRLIHYPDDIKIREQSVRLPHYPVKVSSNAISVWDGRSRIGMIASLKITDRIRCEYNMTYLSADNILHFYNCPNYKVKRLRLKLMGWMIKCRSFPVLFKIYRSKYNIPRRALHYVSAKLHINYDVKIKI